MTRLRRDYKAEILGRRGSRRGTVPDHRSIHVDEHLRGAECTVVDTHLIDQSRPELWSCVVGNSISADGQVPCGGTYRARLCVASHEDTVFVESHHCPVVGSSQMGPSIDR